MRRGCTTFAAIALAACAPLQIAAENDTDVRVIDLRAGASPIGWIDNETILVREDSGQRVERKDGTRRAVFHLVALNYRTGERRHFGRADSQICYADGYVSYINEDYVTGDILAVYGRLGNEMVRKVKPGELEFDRWPGGSCQPWAERPPIPAKWAQGRTEIWPLWPQHGVLSCNVRSTSILNRSVRASFHKPDDETGIELPFSCYDVRRGLQYYPFKRAYFALEQDLVTPWPVGRDRKAYWLFPDGRVETIVLPYSIAIRENMVPTRPGIVGFGRPATRKEEYGVYLVNAGTTKRILRGHAAGVTSPDGCKVAMLHDPEYQARMERRRVTRPVTLKVLDVCASTTGRAP